MRNVVAGASAISTRAELIGGKGHRQVLADVLDPHPLVRKEKARVAAISAHNDAAIGEMVADAAMEKVGGDRDRSH